MSKMGIGKFKTGSIEKIISKLQIIEAQLHRGDLVVFKRSQETTQLYEVERRVNQCDCCGQETWRFRPVDVTIESYRGPPIKFHLIY